MTEKLTAVNVSGMTHPECCGVPLHTRLSAVQWKQDKLPCSVTLPDTHTHSQPLPSLPPRLREGEGQKGRAREGF